MKTMLFKKTILAALTIAIILAAVPWAGAQAAGQSDPIPPAQGQGPGNKHLERFWAHMNRRYERLGKFFKKSDRLAEKAEKMIARLNEAGESTAELEAALKTYQDAVKQAQPIYESCKSIVDSHKGFGAKGKVTDVEQAKETLKELGAKFEEIHAAMNGTGKELIKLMKSIREEHLPAPTS